MNKRLFIALVILMSLSLIGIIFVQGYWIKTAVDNKEEQFSNTVSQVLQSVVQRVEQREIKDYSDKLLQIIDSVGELKQSTLNEVFYLEKNENNNETFIYSHGILEEDYGITATFFDNSFDSTAIKSYVSKRTTIIYREDKGLDGKSAYTPVEKIQKMGNMSEIEKAQFEDYFREIVNRVPVHKRVSKAELEFLIQRELKDRNIDLDFEYGVFANGLATKVKTRSFNLNKSTKYKAPLFSDTDGNTPYSLMVSFPKKKKFLISSIIGMALLSIIFTIIIIVAYSSALFQLIRQKQISEIKTDFINNMTHEFKTPIATINLALDAIKNPKAFADEDKVKRYLKMIRDENHRMHAQVENVLRISKLEKNQLDISKDRVDLHELIEDAITHVELIVEDRGGYVKTHLDAEKSTILANESHFTNVLVNILDNAIKYSPESPKIDIYTEVVKNHIIVKVKDQGTGMTKAVLKRIFEKFYREHTGDIHNVKGHGLGLAYVKRIVDDHQGEVYAESEKNKGSIFYIKLPLI